MNRPRRLAIVTGDVQSGKTTLVENLVRCLRKQNRIVAGIIARGLWQDGRRQGFDLVDLRTNGITPLARRNPRPATDAVTGFSFFDAGLRAGAQALAVQRCATADWIVIDEIGKLELAGDGWAPLLPPLLDLAEPGQIWIVRQSLVDRVCQTWGLSPSLIVSAADPAALTSLQAFCAI